MAEPENLLLVAPSDVVQTALCRFTDRANGLSMVKRPTPAGGVERQLLHFPPREFRRSGEKVKQICCLLGTKIPVPFPRVFMVDFLSRPLEQLVVDGNRLNRKDLSLLVLCR